MPRANGKAIDNQYLITLYTEHHLTMDDIGRLFGVGRQAIHKRLRKLGVKAEQGTWVTGSCAYCGVDIRRRRIYARRRENWYCCNEHYYASRMNPEFHAWRHGGRLARAIVAQHYPLSPTEIVHHKDCNQRNNDIVNLAVYANQSDHLAAHHGRKIDPVWEGDAATRA